MKLIKIGYLLSFLLFQTKYKTVYPFHSDTLTIQNKIFKFVNF